MKNLVKLTDLIPDLVVELIYATPHNFTKVAVYPPHAEAYLCPGPAERLKRVQAELKKRGLALKVWDAYRPHAVQKIFWDLVPDPRYVGDPAVGSKHNRGAAVDVTLVDSRGRELPMPSGFDDFSERAHRSNRNCEKEKLYNVDLLTETMGKAGFEIYPTEWWHFQDPEWEQYPLLDVPL
jgi:D-alanyl-D-alanine dipeptidase